jgi:hypothetical protein
MSVDGMLRDDLAPGHRKLTHVAGIPVRQHRAASGGKTAYALFVLPGATCIAVLAHQVYHRYLPAGLPAGHESTLVHNIKSTSFMHNR